MKRFAILLLFLFATAAPAFSQCSPFMGIGNVQFLDQLGSPLTNGALYVFVAGTSTQTSSYTDSTCTVQNVNPVTFGTGARATIWINTGSFFKYVLCSSSTDGPACAGGNVLFSVDNVPGGATGGGGSSSSPFISGSPSPATTGILRLATGDSICYRNAAGSTNLCISKDSNDLLSWAGGSVKFTEVGAPAGVVQFDILWADNAAHRWKMVNNGGTADTVLGAATTDTLTNKTLSSPIFSGTSTGPGSSQVAYLTSTYTNATTTLTNVTGLSFSVAANTNYKIQCELLHSESATTTGLTIRWTGPASPTAVNYDVIEGVLSNGVIVAGVTSFSSVGLGTGTAITNLPLKTSLTLINGANAGTVQFQAAAQGVGTITILPGSCSLE